MKSKQLRLVNFLLPLMTTLIIIGVAAYWFWPGTGYIPKCFAPFTKILIDGPGEDYLVASILKNDKIYIAASSSEGFNLDPDVKISSSSGQKIAFVACYNLTSGRGWEWARQFHGISLHQMVTTNTSVIIDGTFSREFNVNNSENLSTSLSALPLIPAGENDAFLASFNLIDGNLQSVIHYQNNWNESSIELDITNRANEYTWVTEVSEVSKFNIAEYQPNLLGTGFIRTDYAIESASFRSQSKVINTFTSSGEWKLFILNDKSNTSEVYLTTSANEIIIGGHFHGSNNFSLEAFNPRISATRGTIMEASPTEISDADGNSFIAVYDKTGNQIYLMNGLSKYLEITSLDFDYNRSILTLTGQFDSDQRDRFYDFDLTSPFAPGKKGIVLNFAPGFWIPGAVYTRLITKENAFDGIGDFPCKGVQTTSQGTTVSTGTFDRNVILPDGRSVSSIGGKNNIIQLSTDVSIIVYGNKSHIPALFDESATKELVTFQTLTKGPVNIKRIPDVLGCYPQEFIFNNNNNNIGLLIANK